MERYFTRPGTHPYDEIEWEKRHAVIIGEDGKTVFEQHDVEFPQFWSQLATNVVASKYFRGPLDDGQNLSDGYRCRTRRRTVEQDPETASRTVPEASMSVLPGPAVVDVVARPEDYSLGVDDAERPGCSRSARCTAPRPSRCSTGSASARVRGRSTWAAARSACSTCWPSRSVPTGQVVGIDRDPATWPWRRARCASAARTEVQLVEADATGTGLPAGSLRPGARAAAAGQRAAAGRGGRRDGPADQAGWYLAVQDVDWISWTCVPAHPDWDRLVDAAAAAWSGDVHIGRRLPALLRAAGLVDVRVRGARRVFRPPSPTTGCCCDSPEIHRERILAGGPLRAELDRCVRRAGRPPRPGRHLTLYATLFQAWGRRPDAR